MAKRRRGLGFFRTILIAASVILFWRGAWGLMDIYFFPNNQTLSYLASIVLGVTILLATKK
ncbi:hypothetical protein HYT60_02125, partial [Candidatus Woesebacteria bacterium]|nr:hypothetical protein [Candidatus Woesebacteria bacterium]